MESKLNKTMNLNSQTNLILNGENEKKNWFKEKTKKI
jgi:hypothetical protein